MGIKKIERFLAHDDSGEVYGVIKHQERPTGGVGLKSGRVSFGRRFFWKLADGRDVNCVSDDDETEFEIVDTEEKLRRV